MTARETFEVLGYKLIHEDEETICYKGYAYSIKFYKVWQYIELFDIELDRVLLDFCEIQAIEKLLEEVRRRIK